MRRVLIAAFVIVIAIPVAAAQSVNTAVRSTKEPTLTTTEKQHIQLTLQALEIAQLRLQLAARDVEKLWLSLQKPGYKLDLQRLEYVAEVSEEKTK